MQYSHQTVLNKYEQFRSNTRSIAHNALPTYLKKATALKVIDNRAINVSKFWKDDIERMVDCDWNFVNRYIYCHPKAFDLSVWVGNTLCSLTLGRPSYNGTFMRLDFIEKAPTNCPFSSDMVPISILAYETYATLIGAKQFRIIDPTNDKVLRSYMQHGGFSHIQGRKGNPHYLVRDIK